MFGFIVANPEKLTDEQNKRYKSVYCGLCEDLGEKGLISRMTLTYDLVFLAIVLSAALGEEYAESEGRCPVHIARKRKYLRNKYTAYAADMNIALVYHKYLDDWDDDKSYQSLIKSGIFRKEVGRIENLYPRQCEAIKNCLDELHKVEKAGILVPDVPAVIFGKLLGAVFAVDESPLKSFLYDFGFSLGKFIYIMDAAVDLRSDIKKQKYNPLVQYSFSTVEPALKMIMAECVELFNAIEIKQDKEIIENILFSGVWTAYEARRKGNKK